MFGNRCVIIANQVKLKQHIIYTYDIETLVNLFVYCAVDDNNNWKTFTVGVGINDLVNLYKFLHHDGLQFVGYNNLAFDAPVIQHLLDNEDRFLQYTTDQAVDAIYNYAQSCIDMPFPPYRETQLTHPQIDVYKIMHFDNNAKRTSLKALQVNMNWENVQDMPFDHTHHVTPQELQEVIEYCKNDVASTQQFYKNISTEISLRENLSKTFKVNFTNMSDSAIGERLFAVLYCKQAKVSWAKIRKLKTWRNSIAIKDILLPTINFQTDSLKELLKKFKELTVYDTNKGFSGDAKVGGLKTHYGLGGVHACIKPGVYESDEEHVVRDIDVASFYPNLAIVNGWHPEHLGSAFPQVYQKVYDDRKAIPKKDPRNLAYKLMLNSVFGKSNSQYSWLYDPQFTMQITVNGQLLISMLAEQLAQHGQLLQINTDGLTIRYNKKFDATISHITDLWQKQTKLQLEDVYYKKMIIRDVNNYIAVNVDGEIKKKGCFATEIAWHQNPSAMIVADALEQYFVHNQLPETYIPTINNGWRFVIRQRFLKNQYGWYKNNQGNRVKLPKTIRFYASNTGFSLNKHFLKNGVTPSDQMFLEGQPVTVINSFDGTLPTDVATNYYVKETYRVINQIFPTITEAGEQLTLFG